MFNFALLLFSDRTPTRPVSGLTVHVSGNSRRRCMPVNSNYGNVFFFFFLNLFRSRTRYRLIVIIFNASRARVKKKFHRQTHLLGEFVFRGSNRVAFPPRGVSHGQQTRSVVFASVPTSDDSSYFSFVSPFFSFALPPRIWRRGREGSPRCLFSCATADLGVDRPFPLAHASMPYMQRTFHFYYYFRPRIPIVNSYRFLYH